MLETVTIEGFGPIPVHRPTTVAEAGDLIRQSASKNQVVYPLGGRTALGIGLPPTKSGVALDLRSLNGLIDYPAADMTITVQAGMTVTALKSHLAKEKQWLPVDLARPNEATIGGAVAVNASGSRRLGYGTLRDYLIGISFLTDGGEEVKGGGRVVKNVAGYDLMKLQLGAIGTLGIITQLTFKVKPMPEDRAVVVFGISNEKLAAVLDTIHASNSRPVAVDVLNPRAANMVGLGTNSDWTVVVGLEEKAVTVKWQVETLMKDLGLNFAVRTAEDALAVWSSLTELTCRTESKFLWKSSVLPSRVSDELKKASANINLIHAHALSGIIWLHTDENQSDATANRICKQAPSDWKTPARVWGAPNDEWRLKAHIKQTLDPGNVFNPGRMFTEALN